MRRHTHLIALISILIAGCFPVYEGVAAWFWSGVDSPFTKKSKKDSEPDNQRKTPPKDDPKDDDGHDHECGCVHRPGRSANIIRCDSSGNVDSRGDYICCSKCAKRCGNWPKQTDDELRSKPPGLIPIPPRCENHCGQTENCKVGEGPCCKSCHQACPPWQSVDKRRCETSEESGELICAGN